MASTSPHGTDPLSPRSKIFNIPVISTGFAQLMVVPSLDFRYQQASQRQFSAQCSGLLPYPETAGALERDFPVSALWSRKQGLSRISPPLAQTNRTHPQTFATFPGPQQHQKIACFPETFQLTTDAQKYLAFFPTNWGPHHEQNLH